MKKLSIIIFICLTAVFSCIEKDNTFYDKVLNDFSKHSDFIAIDIKSHQYNGRVIIENNDLYTLMNQTKGWDKTVYKSKIERLLIHRRSLNIGNTDLIKAKFLKVKQINKVYISASKGVNSFISDYFSGKVFNYSVAEDEMYAVINQLFYWSIPVKFDDVSGQLLLDNQQ
jgi:hypothetical protein